MTLRFVKTSVLSSSDGIDFSNEVAVESEETKMARVAAERAAARPLFEQLAEQRQKKQDEYDANTKLMFAPPKSLDAEDITFLQGVQDSQQAIQRRRKEEEELALEQFRAATRKEAPAHVPVVHTVKVAVPEKKAMSVSTVIRGKRKVEPGKVEEAAHKVTKVEAAVADQAASSLFSAYGSDDEDENQDHEES